MGAAEGAAGFALIPGRASELRAAPALLLIAALLGTIRRAVCDGAYSFAAWLALVLEAGAQPVVRATPTHPMHPHFNRAALRRRHRAENLGARLKKWRAVATRYGRTATRFSGGLHLAAAFDCLSNRP